jgi:predicted ATPase
MDFHVLTSLKLPSFRLFLRWLVLCTKFKTWNDRELDKVNEIDTIITFLKTQQKLIYLTGEGGTGKSRCIEALQFFCNQWGRPDAIAKTALTGKAAVGVEGKFII